MNRRYLIRGGNVITPEGIREHCDVLICDGRIIEVCDSEVSRMAEMEVDEVLKAEGLYVSPGFVDIHQHGGGGFDYMDEDPDGYERALKAHAAHGMTSVMPTLLSASREHTIRAIKQYVKVSKKTDLPCNLLGIHLEGPFLSPEQAGAQKPENLRVFTEEEYKTIYESSEGLLKRWSVAPELDGMEGFTAFAKEKGITLSIAHSNAEFDTVEKAFLLGFQHVTHFYSCISSIVRKGGFRIAGIVEAAYYLDDMDVEIIADGCHLPQSLLKFITKMKGTKHVALVTDAMRAAGQNVTESFLGSKEDPLPVVIEDGVAKMMSREAFAGSVATCDRLVRNMLAVGVPLKDAVEMITINPLRMMHLDVKKGEIKVGYDADLCIFDQNVNVKSVMVGGKVVY